MPPPGPVTIHTPLHSDALVFESMRGVEPLGRPFEYLVNLSSNDPDIKLKDLLGQPMTIDLQLSDAEQRHFSGYVVAADFVEADGFKTLYRVTLAPWFSLLRNNANCRVFQNRTVPEIVKDVFAAAGFSDFDTSLIEEYPKNEYVVQYRESDFNFVSRLLEDAGIYYYFRHSESAHTMVLCDSYSAHTSAPGCDELPYYPPDAHRDTVEEYVDRWQLSQQITPGAVALQDFDFERPNADLSARRSSPKDHERADYEVYDYPGDYTQRRIGEDRARVGLEQRQDDYALANGHTNARRFTVGALFNLTTHPREDQNAEYLVTAARWSLEGHRQSTHAADSELAYSCEFSAVPSRVPFRTAPTTQKPFVKGPQTAIVVGKEGAEIWTDTYGRVKVQFHWDRLGEHNENSSCWMRVSQAWAGSNWGAIHIPRVGQEVIVDFLEGDPDRPIITGRVYNGMNMPPYELPKNQTQSGIKSRSTPNGKASPGNEIRFEDLTGLEDMYIHAQGTQTTVVERDQSADIGGSRTLLVRGSETVTVLRGRATSVTVADNLNVLGPSTTTIVGSCTAQVGGALQTSVGGARTESVSLNATLDVAKDSVTHVGGITRFDLDGALRVTAGGDETRTTGGTVQVRVGKEASYLYAAETGTVVGHPDREASVSMYVYGPSATTTTKDLVIESKTSIVLQCGDTKVEITPDGVKIGGKTIGLAGSSEVGVTSPNASLVLNDNVAVVGKEVSVASTGASLSLQSEAKLIGSKVQLGAGSGKSASTSAQQKKAQDDKKPVYVRVKMLRSGKPAAGVAYTLTLDGGTVLSGSTTGAGLVEQKVPATVASAVLKLLDTGETRTLTMSVIEPVDTVLGAQHRLTRLGYYHGPNDGVAGPLTAHALGAFQKARGLTVSEKLDGPTQGALKKAYGS